MEGLSRATGNPDEIEGMKQLRVIILHPNGTVEVNRQIDFSNNPPESYIGIYRVKPAENKKIYAIANPGSTGFDFDAYTEGSEMESALESHVFTFDSSIPVSMSDSREIAAKDLKAGERTEVELNLARIATKFTVVITNNRLEKVTLKNFSISSLAEKQYLMPHFTGTDNQHIVSNDGLKGFDWDGGLTGMHWSDWLRLAVEESQAAPTDQTLADRRGWIMKYNVPDDAGHQARPFSLPTSCEMPVEGGKLTLPIHYFAESRSGLRPSSSFGGGAAAGFEQNYTFNVGFNSDESGEKQFENQVLPNVRALFRNTHVVLNITLHQQKVTCVVSVLPYCIIDLRPGFGWDQLPEKDPEGEEDPRLPLNPDKPGTGEGGGSELETP